MPVYLPSNRAGNRKGMVTWIPKKKSGLNIAAQLIWKPHNCQASYNPTSVGLVAFLSARLLVCETLSYSHTYQAEISQLLLGKLPNLSTSRQQNHLNYHKLSYSHWMIILMWPFFFFFITLTLFHTCPLVAGFLSLSQRTSPASSNWDRQTDHLHTLL